MTRDEVVSILRSREGYRVCTDSTMLAYSKKELVSFIRVLEHNWAVTEDALHHQAENVKDWEPVKHAHWVDVTPIAATWGRRFKCSICGRCVAILPLDYSKGVVSIYPYCHCGAKMDEVPSNG